MAKAPAIDRIELFRLHVPFRAAVREAMAAGEGGLGMAIPAEEPWTGGDFVIVRLRAEDGSEGVGEAFVWLPETGVSPAQVVDAVAHGLARYVLGASPFEVEPLRARMDANVARSEVAKGLLDIACYDLMGRIAGRPACDFMGGRGAETLPLAALIPLGAPDGMVDLALAFQRGGTRTFRLKLGRGIESDRAIIARAREALGDDVRLRVDYNQAYAPDDAVRAIEAIAPYGIDCAEQPVRADDWLGMARVQRAVSVPVMAASRSPTSRCSSSSARSASSASTRSGPAASRRRSARSTTRRAAGSAPCSTTSRSASLPPRRSTSAPRAPPCSGTRWSSSGT